MVVAAGVMCRVGKPGGLGNLGSGSLGTGVDLGAGAPAKPVTPNAPGGGRASAVAAATEIRPTPPRGAAAEAVDAEEEDIALAAGERGMVAAGGPLSESKAAVIAAGRGGAEGSSLAVPACA